MAELLAGAGSTLDMGRFSIIYDGDIAGTAHHVTVTLDENHFGEFTGDFTFNADGSFADGTVTGISETVGGHLQYAITDIVPISYDVLYDSLSEYDMEGVLATIFGRDDRITGGDGADHLRGFTGDDVLYGEHGQDLIEGDAGRDKLVGGTAADVLYGGDGDDHIYGNSGGDRLHGGAGDDYVRGGGGDDVLYGKDGDDILRGSSGDDDLHGQDGDDVLVGGTGVDHIWGGTGHDRIAYTEADESPAARYDTLEDFVSTDEATFRRDMGDVVPDTDKIDLSKLAGSHGLSFIGVDVAFSGVAGEVLFQDGAGGEGDEFGFLKADLDGDGRADFTLKIDTAFLVDAHDLILA